MFLTSEPVVFLLLINVILILYVIFLSFSRVGSHRYKIF